MFSSPARATPRKSVFRGRGESASISRGTPSVISEKEAFPTPSRTSRFNTLKRAASPTSTAGETSKTARYEYDDVSDGRVYLARDERMEVVSLGGLPRDVQSIVKHSDTVHAAVKGHIDPMSGYAFVVTPNMCIAWNYTRRTSVSPTTYVFPAPTSSRPYPAQTPPPVIAAFHNSGSGEPGVVLVSPSGEIRFWESTSQALSNVDRYQAIQLDLGQEDFADKIYTLDQNNFIIATTSSLAFRLSINTDSGRRTPIATPLMRPGGIFGRASPTIFSSNEDEQGIMALLVEGSNMWIMAARTLQKWQLTNDGQKYIQDMDLYDVVGHGAFPGRTGEIQIDIHDLVSVGQGQLAALISTDPQDTPTSSYGPIDQDPYSIVILSTSGRGGGTTVTRIIPISYVPTSPNSTTQIPRLIIPAGSKTAFIQFASIVLSVSMVEDDSNEETITLRDPTRNIFIGTGHLTSTNLKRPSPPLILMAASGGLLGVNTFSPPLARGRSSQVIATKRLKFKIEQAVLFGDRPENPLTFDVPSDIEGDLDSAAEAVSSEILSCNSANMPSIYELRPQLSDRLSRLKELIGYIKRNGLLVMLSQSSRRLLSRDGEKAKAAVELWDYQNRLMDQMHTRSPQSLLSDSIMVFMNQYGGQEDDDRVRLFFRHQCQHLDKLLEIVYATFQDALSALDGSRAGSQERSAWILETNKIFIIIVRAAAQYREETLSFYSLNRQQPSIEQWTAQDSIMSPLEHLYSLTEILISDRTRELGSAIDAPPTATETSSDIKSARIVQNTLKNQLAELAAALCNNMEDKLRVTSRHMIDGGEEQEGIALEKKWEELRPRVIRPLVSIDRVSQAYALAEHHNDYETLVWLCHDQMAGSGSGVVRLQEYIERFGEEFAFVLYQWYIDQGQYHALLSQDEVYGGLVTKFFSMTDYPQLSWLHHIACGRYGAAAGALGKVDARESDLNAKHIISSIGKLSAVAEMRIKGDSEKRKQALIAFDDQLDLIQVQEKLRSALLATSTRRLSPQDALKEYLSKNLTLLEPRQVFMALIHDLTGRLVAGEALDVEGLVDVLTLKDNLDERGRGDPSLALDRLRSDTVLPEGRKQVALLSIWRRVFIRDDWIYLSNTAGKSEEMIQNMLRKTLTYATLKSIGEINGFPQAYILSPYTSAQPPLLAELSARFPDRSSSEIDGLMRDHQDEIALLERYMDEAGLEARVKEVAELVKRDAELELDVDAENQREADDGVDM